MTRRILLFAVGVILLLSALPARTEPMEKRCFTKDGHYMSPVGQYRLKHYEETAKQGHPEWLSYPEAVKGCHAQWMQQPLVIPDLGG